MLINELGTTSVCRSPIELRVSLHMAVHNTRPFVQTAIESILGQNFTDFDLTLWDDGSTDGSREILDNIAREHANVQLFGGQHQGVAASLNSAIQTSRGEYIGWVPKQ